MVHLTGAKVILREKRLEDAWDDYLWRSDEELATLDAAPRLKMTFYEYLRIFKDQLRYPIPGTQRFSLESLDHKLIGNCMYYDVDAINKEAELGIVIGNKDYWNQGYGHDAVVILLEHLFSTARLERVYLHTLVWNKRAQGAFQKSGFQPVRQVCRHGKDFVLMEIRKESWLEIREEKLAARSLQAKPANSDEQRTPSNLQHFEAAP